MGGGASRVFINTQSQMICLEGICLGGGSKSQQKNNYGVIMERKKEILKEFSNKKKIPGVNPKGAAKYRLAILCAVTKHRNL